MSELTFEQMLEESLKTIHAGEVVEGTVIDVKPEEVILNIGYKSDGVLTRNEYTNDSSVDMTTVVKPGDKMEVKVLKVNDGDGQVILSYKRLAADRGNKRIEEAYNIILNEDGKTFKIATRRIDKSFPYMGSFQTERAACLGQSLLLCPAQIPPHRTGYLLPSWR